MDGFNTTQFPESTPPLEERIGAYRLVREIGRGGMGTVYLGVRDDDSFQKRVALKVLNRGMDTDTIVQRFRHERQILAGLQHPYIANLIDGGTTADGRPYFAMEYVEGRSIIDYSDARQLDTSDRLELFRKICAAVQYAHQNLIIHRDLKPANVLVSADGVPKLLDFGIAKLLNPELSGITMAPTAAGFQLMTPEYASPEQIRGEAITTATDVYSLAVILYELLTGRRPFRLTSREPSELIEVVCKSAPTRPSTAVGAPEDAGQEPPANPEQRGQTDAVNRLRRRLLGDIDTIVLKALSKEPERRYASVDQFSEDIRRHLVGLPVLARPDTIGYRVSKFVRRHRGGVAAAALVLLALMAGLVGTAWQANVARAQRQRAEQRFEDLRALAKAFIFDLDDVLVDLEGSTPARQIVVRKGLEYLDRLAADANSDHTLQRELARGYIKLGDVQGRALNPNLGDASGALQSYRKAVSVLETLAARTPDDDALAAELVIAYARVSPQLVVTGDTQAALDVATRAEQLQRALTDRNQSDDSLRALVTAQSGLGDLQARTGNTRAALDRHRSALATMQTLFARDQQNINNWRQLGVAHHKVANVLGNPNFVNVGDYAGALSEIQLCVDVFGRSVQRFPGVQILRRNLAVANGNMADILGALKRRDEALASQHKALAEFQALADADPRNAAAMNDLAISLYKIGQMLDEGGDASSGEQNYRRALNIHQRLADADPNNASWKNEVATSLAGLAAAQSHSGKRVESLANYGRSVTMLKELRDGDPANAERRLAVARALADQAEALALFARESRPTRASDLATAEKLYVEAMGIFDRLRSEGALEGSDAETSDETRQKLDAVRLARARHSNP